MGKCVLITGASRGIGRETARLFANEGHRVIINYNNSEERAFSLSEELTGAGRSALPVRADVSDPEQVGKMFETAERSFGPVDILINNAGISLWGPVNDLSPGEWDRLFDVNVKGVFLCCKAALPGMLRKDCEKKGKIINISSIWGIAGASCEAAYSASKAAVIGFTRALAKELGPSGITVNCVAPGVILSDMTRSLGEDTLSSLKGETPLGALGTPRDIAETVFFLASEKADFITGQVISPNGGVVI
jgi:3-oxoacyl-[acyl-carrier protein] reductase